MISWHRWELFFTVIQWMPTGRGPLNYNSLSTAVALFIIVHTIQSKRSV
jgi:hypothetical protein